MESLEVFFNSFVLVFLGEMGDKTQLLALILAARYKKPVLILFGIFIATLLNHALAAFFGGWLAALVDPSVLRWGLALTFFAFAAWILIPDKEEELKVSPKYGVLLTTIVAFFVAEMGDKTQLATIALGARYFESAWMVTLGTTVGMLASNSLAIFLGHHLLAKIPMKYVRIFASFVFVVFGILVATSVGFETLK